MNQRFNLRASLCEVGLLEEGKLRLRLSSCTHGRYSPIVDAYGLQLRAHRIPESLLPGVQLLIHNATWRLNKLGKKGYLLLDSKSSLDVLSSEDAAAAMPAAEAWPPRLQPPPARCLLTDLIGEIDISALGVQGAAADATPPPPRHKQKQQRSQAAAFQSAAKSPAGSPGRTTELLGRLISLNLSVKRLSEFWCGNRCCACGMIRDGHSCRCSEPTPATARVEGTLPLHASLYARRPPLAPSVFEVCVKAEVSDGSGSAYLEVTGDAVWALLQTPAAQVAQLREVCDWCGPLKVVAEFPHCVTGAAPDSRPWRCGSSTSIRESDHAVLKQLIPQSGSWQRSFLTVCRCVRQPSQGKPRETKIMYAGGEHKVLRREGSVQLEALWLEPLSARQQLKIELEALGL
tara:strand:+ start:712 stop:1920 length:1209 start_codon:yes stop_codon:yes gene_type:complete